MLMAHPSLCLCRSTPRPISGLSLLFHHLVTFDATERPKVPRTSPLYAIWSARSEISRP
jgi:hypothetical protein